MDITSWWPALWKLRLQEFDSEIFHGPGIKQLAPDGLSRLNMNGHDDTNIVEEITDLPPTTADMEAIDTFSEHDPISQQGAPYPDLKQAEEPIFGEIFLSEQARDLECQNHSPIVPKADSNIYEDTEWYLVDIAHIDGALQKLVPTNPRKRFFTRTSIPVCKAHQQDQNVQLDLTQVSVPLYRQRLIWYQTRLPMLRKRP